MQKLIHFGQPVGLYNPRVSLPWASKFCTNGGYGKVYGTGYVDIFNAPSFFSSEIVAAYLLSPFSVGLLDHSVGPVGGLSV